MKILRDIIAPNILKQKSKPLDSSLQTTVSVLTLILYQEFSIDYLVKCIRPVSVKKVIPALWTL